MTDANKKNIVERINDVTKFSLGPLPANSGWLKPVRVNYVQDGKSKNWDLALCDDGVMIVTFNRSSRKLVLVKQFRPAVYLNRMPKGAEVDFEKYPAKLGVTIELCGGTVDKNKTLAEIAQDELKEECGYEAPLSAFEYITTTRSIGAITGAQTIFYVEVNNDMHTQAGGGLEEEGELIEVINMSISEVKEYIKSEDFNSPLNFLFGIEWFLHNKKNVYEC
ncbi:unnamed protein product [Trichogramma brassicae]|uniref:Uridine diphosphate glucose pyrophosphatase NUDT14 n=1 Tax=Trichogramma brassicae TaxID=86971 RepID=A0A6H5I3K1_9HYME|nr:unnamed protein product [Trichogramma brassicae]